MRQTHYEVRPLKDDRAVMTFPDKFQAISWIRRRNEAHRTHTPVRLVEVITFKAVRELVV